MGLAEIPFELLYMQGRADKANTANKLAQEKFFYKRSKDAIDLGFKITEENRKVEEGFRKRAKDYRDAGLFKKEGEEWIAHDSFMKQKSTADKKLVDKATNRLSKAYSPIEQRMQAADVPMNPQQLFQYIERRGSTAGAIDEIIDVAQQKREKATRATEDVTLNKFDADIINQDKIKTVTGQTLGEVQNIMDRRAGVQPSPFRQYTGQTGELPMQTEQRLHEQSPYRGTQAMIPSTPTEARYKTMAAQHERTEFQGELDKQLAYEDKMSRLLIAQGDAALRKFINREEYTTAGSERDELLNSIKGLDSEIQRIELGGGSMIPLRNMKKVQYKLILQRNKSMNALIEAQKHTTAMGVVEKVFPETMEDIRTQDALDGIQKDITVFRNLREGRSMNSPGRRKR